MADETVSLGGLSAGSLGQAPLRLFRSSEWAIASGAAAGLQLLFLLVLIAAGNNERIVPKVEEPTPTAMPIAVTPVLDDLPLLKLGNKVKQAKLPDMWKKQAPRPVYEAKSAPAAEAEDKVEAIPTASVAQAEEVAPPPSAEVVASADAEMQKIQPSAAEEANYQEEGSPGGVAEGTETDPLKAMAVSQYRMQIIRWFNRRWAVPTSIPCDELKGLRVVATASVAGDRTIASFTIASPSGNATFDQSVSSALAGAVGAELPPPPDNYPDIVGQVVTASFQKSQCQ